MMYLVCPDCGAHLDPGEACDCKENVASGGNDTESDKEKLDTGIITENGGIVNMAEEQLTVRENYPVATLDAEIMAVRQLPVIAENLRAVQPYIQSRLQEALEKPCTEETVKQIKEIRAQLNKEFKALEDRRKEIKSTVIAPYLQLEATYKDCVSAPYSQADTVLRDRIAYAEMNILSSKAAEAVSYFEEYLQTLSFIPPGFVSFDKSGLKVNMSTSLKKLKEQAKAFLDRVNDDCEAISMEEHAAEIMVEYKGCFDLSAATLAVKRRKEAAKAFVPKEEIRQAEPVPTPEPPREAEEAAPALSAPIPQPSGETEHTVSFTVTAPIEKLRALTQFLRQGEYTWKQIKA